jgi:hypothetical protein
MAKKTIWEHLDGRIGARLGRRARITPVPSQSAAYEREPQSHTDFVHPLSAETCHAFAETLLG